VAQPPKPAAAKAAKAATAAKAKPAVAKRSARKKAAVPDPHKPVTAAERGLLDAVRGDGVFDARKLKTTERVVRSGFLRALLLGRINGAVVPETGLATWGLVFEEILNLDYAARDGAPLPPLWLQEAHFKTGARFISAHLNRLDLEGSRSDAAITLDRAQVLGNVWLDRLQLTGGLSLMGAEIGGQLTLEGASLKGATDDQDRVTGDALSADGAVIKGDVFCRPAEGHRFEAVGEVRLLGAEIGGQLSLNGASLKGATDDQGRVIGNALSADGAVIKGGVFCRPAEGHRFEAEGEVRLSGTEIGGQLSLNGASLKGATDDQGRVIGNALSADEAVIKGGVFCRPAEGHRFEAEGTVRLLGATIGGQLSLRGSVLKAPGGLALAAQRLSVSDATILTEGTAIVGEVNLRGATLSDLFVQGEIKALSADADALHLGDASLRRLDIRGLSGLGKVNLEGATADTFDGFYPKLWGDAPTATTGLELDLDGFTYRRAEFSREMPKRHRTWARFAPWDTHAIAENVLELLDREFRDTSPGRVHYMPQPFEAAARALREAGYDREANAVAVAKREFKRRCRADGRLAAGISSLSCLFFRHGYGPARATLWMIAFVAIGGFAVWGAQALDLLVTVPSTGQAATRCTEVPVAFALDAFLPLVDLGVDKQCQISRTPSLWPVLEGLRVTYAILGWLFVPMVALTYAGVLRKD